MIQLKNNFMLKIVDIARTEFYCLSMNFQISKIDFILIFLQHFSKNEPSLELTLDQCITNYFFDLCKINICKILNIVNNS